MHLDVNGTRSHVTDTGTGHAVLLLLHGMGCDGTDWQPQVDAFADRYRCITTPLTQAEELAGAIPGARLEVVSEAGHLSNIENPVAVNELLAKQLESDFEYEGPR